MGSNGQRCGWRTTQGRGTAEQCRWVLAQSMGGVQTVWGIMERVGHPPTSAVGPKGRMAAFILKPCGPNLLGVSEQSVTLPICHLGGPSITWLRR